mgnify:CR=1 FL=1
MKYKNVLLVFPTIALLSENLTKIYSDPRYLWIKEQYKIHTVSNVSPDDLGEYNVFIYTPERYLSFLDFKQNVIFWLVFFDKVVFHRKRIKFSMSDNVVKIFNI